MLWRKTCWHGLGCVLLVLLAACGHAPRTMVNDASRPMGHWEGRLTLQVAKNPPEQFSTAFEMTGHAEQGELALLSPLGTTLAMVRWDSHGASLQKGVDIQQFDSMDALTQRLTGASLPLPALLTWLDRAGPPVAGWKISAQNLKSGRRVLAERQQPLPALQLTLLLDPSS
ncbi:MAG: outer membrane lipoprotein LolB [Betaproteobacteria bacterium]|nr:outer membrane lipoprotein LolB [Betaproteobacteria bacterium]